MWDYVEKQIDHLLMQSQSFRTDKIPDWKRMLKGKPRSEQKNFPFENASNLVVQLIATRVEQILSRIMAIYMIDPLFAVTALGDLIGQDTDEMSQVLQQFLSDMAIEPEALNLYRKEELFFHDAIAYGTNFMYFPYMYITESQYTGIAGTDFAVVGLSRKDEFKTIVTKDGPSPENLPLQQCLVDNKLKNFDQCRFFARIVPLTREAVEDRIAFGIWSAEAGQKVLNSPDTAEGLFTADMENDSKNFQSSGNLYDAIYKIFECHFKFTHNQTTYSIIAHFHRSSTTRLSAVFNYFPKNQFPIEDCRFGYDSDNFFGYGFCEMLAGYQDEVSTLHNNRLDNEAIRNNVTFRINKDSELASTLKFYPGVAIPADEDEVEVLPTASGNPVDNGGSESITIGMANERSGVDPAISGMGQGIVNPKRGVYSSQGTMAVLQQQNNRTGLRMMDVRQTHLRIGRKLVDMYAFMGAGNKIARYGEQAKDISKALDAVKAGGLGLLLKQSSGSSNIENDRQNSVLIQGMQEKYIGIVNQVLAAMQQQQQNPEQNQFLADVLIAQRTLSRHILRIFGYFDVDKLLPIPASIKNARATKPQSVQGNTSNASSGQAQGTVPVLNSGRGSTIPVGVTQ
jgi:hypothetical protein